MSGKIANQYWFAIFASENKSVQISEESSVDQRKMEDSVVENTGKEKIRRKITHWHAYCFYIGHKQNRRCEMRDRPVQESPGTDMRRDRGQDKRIKEKR